MQGEGEELDPDLTKEEVKIELDLGRCHELDLKKEGKNELELYQTKGEEYVEYNYFQREC